MVHYGGRSPLRANLTAVGGGGFTGGGAPCVAIKPLFFTGDSVPRKPPGLRALEICVIAYGMGGGRVPRVAGYLTSKNIIYLYIHNI